MIGLHVDNQMLPSMELEGLQVEQQESSVTIADALAKLKETVESSATDYEVIKIVERFVRLVKNHHTLRYPFDVSALPVNPLLP